MRKAAFAGLFLLVVIVAGNSKTSAQTLEILQVDKPNAELSQSTVLSPFDVPEPTPEPPPKPEPKKHKIVENESLSKIAELYNTTWKRLFDKNEFIQDPDNLKAGDELVIPNADEVLKERSLPTPPPVSTPGPKPRTTAKKGTNTQLVAKPRGSSGGNLYSAGYCTWYAKDRRPDLPNNLGNADTWVARARAQGIPTGSTPRVGAIGQQGMHVVYVENVNGDGTVTISEMNFRGRYVISSRTVAASNFMYIY